LGVWELAFVTFGGFFFEFLTPFTLGVHNFFNYIPFLKIFIVPNAPTARVWTPKTMEPALWI
jgi:hypothetical protein